MTYKRVSDCVVQYQWMKGEGGGRRRKYNNNHENDDEKWAKMGR